VTAPRVCIALVAATPAALVASVAVGEFSVPPLDVISALVGAGDQATHFIVFDLRLPRALTGLLAGAALGLAGMVFQDVTRNPLVSPDIVGIAAGASLAAVALIVFGSTSGAAPVPLAALAGALISGVALYGLAWRRGIHGYRLVLVGIGITAFADAGIYYVFTEGRIFEVARAYVWLVGSLNSRSWEQVWPLAAALAALLPLLLALAGNVDVLRFGDDVAAGLGVRVERTRMLLLAAATGLTAAAVACAGPIGFVAFGAPHVARALTGVASVRSALVAAAACGALLVLAADVAGRMLFAPHEIPVGIVTSILAAPYFLFLLKRMAV
jgi:iron complex transport system permease protein